MKFTCALFFSSLLLVCVLLAAAVTLIQSQPEDPPVGEKGHLPRERFQEFMPEGYDATAEGEAD